MATYSSRYAEITATEALRAVAGFADGVPVIAISQPGSNQLPYFLRLEFDQERVTTIRDYCYVPYLALEALFT